MGLLMLAFMVTAAPALAQESTPTPTPPSPTDLPDGGETTVTVEENDRRSDRRSTSSDPDRPPGSGDSTDDVSPWVPSPSPSPITKCEPFAYRQIYRNWGPASAYGGKVWVRYGAERCVTIENGILRITMDGTAEIREGRADGKLVARRPFELRGTWVHPSISAGWPPDWWQCGVTDLDYVWRIAGRYSFEVEADDGKWTLDVVTVRGGKTRTVHWAYDACR
jgi:hypothetical protein